MAATSPFTPPGSFCSNVSDCFPCFVLPTTNTSAEDPDVLQDFSIQWGNLQNNTPPLGTLFTANGCQSLCVSDISQDDAFLCAARQQAACVIHNWNPPPIPPPVCFNPPCSPPVPPPNVPPISVFSSTSASCTQHCPDGTPFTFTVPAGSFVAASQELADREAASYACRQATLHRVCMTFGPSQMCVGSSVPLNLTATGMFLDAAANFWELRSGTLPTGYSFSSTIAGPTLTIPGTATASGSFTFTVRVTAPNGDFVEKQFTSCVVGLSPATALPNASVGVAYSQFISVNACAGSNIVWAVTSGALPLGLTLNQITGEISGSPDSSTANQGFQFTIAAQIE